MKLELGLGLNRRKSWSDGTFTPVAPILDTPTIDDTTPAQDQVLTASYTYSNSPVPTPSASYQWKRGVTNVGTDSANYTVQAGDIGSTLTVTVTTTNSAGSDNETSAATSAVTAGTAPILDVPIIDDTTPFVGQTLTASHAYSNSPFPTPTVTRQWKRGVTSVGTDSANYTVQAGDVGFTLTVTVGATNSAGADAETSAATSPVAALPVAPILATATIDDTSPTAGQILLASYTYGNSPVPTPTVSYQWKRGVTNVGINSANYTVQIGDVGSTLTVTVTAVNSGGGDVETSAATSTVVAAPSPVADPTLDLDSASDTGISTTDNITTDTTPTLNIAFGEDLLENDTITVKLNSVDQTPIVVDAAEAAADVVDLGLSPLSIGAHTIQIGHGRTGLTTGWSNTLSITVEAVDVTPSAFTFVDVDEAVSSYEHISSPITVSGINMPVTIQVSSGTFDYRVNGGTWLSSADTVNVGDVVELKMTSSASVSTSVEAELDIGGVLSTWTVTTSATGTFWEPTELDAAFYYGLRLFETDGSNVAAEITKDGSNRVTAATDWSGSGHNTANAAADATCFTYSATGLDASTPGLVATTSGSFLRNLATTAIPVGTEIHTFAVGKIANEVWGFPSNRFASFANNNGDADTSVGNGFIALCQGGGNGDLVISSGPATTGSDKSYALNTPMVISTSVTPTASVSYVNGVAGASGASTLPTNHPLTKLGVGNSPTSPAALASLYGGGVLTELDIITGSLLTADRQKMEGYLAYKFNQETLLDTSHPHRWGPPSGSASAGFTARAVRFNSADPDYMTGPGSTAYTGGTTFRSGLLSFWVKWMSDGTFMAVHEPAVQSGLNVMRFNDNTLYMFVASAIGTGGTMAMFTAPARTASAGWLHYLWSFDVDTAQNELYIDDVVASGSYSLDGAHTATNGTASTISFGARGAGSLPANMEIAAFQFWPGISPDLSNSANRRLHIDAALKMVDPTTHGLGTPIIDLRLAGADAEVTFADNKGSGGDIFTLTGTLAAAASSPTD